MNRALVIAVCILASAAAHADVWQRAIDGETAPDLAAVAYESAMRDGARIEVPAFD